MFVGRASGSSASNDRSMRRSRPEQPKITPTFRSVNSSSPLSSLPLLSSSPAAPSSSASTNACPSKNSALSAFSPLSCCCVVAVRDSPLSSDDTSCPSSSAAAALPWLLLLLLPPLRLLCSRPSTMVPCVKVGLSDCGIVYAHMMSESSSVSHSTRRRREDDASIHAQLCTAKAMTGSYHYRADRPDSLFFLAGGRGMRVDACSRNKHAAHASVSSRRRRRSHIPLSLLHHPP